MQRENERSSISWFIPQMAKTTAAKPIRIQEQSVSFRCSTRMQRTNKGLGHPSYRSKAGSWIKNKAAAVQTTAYMGCCFYSRELACYAIAPVLYFFKESKWIFLCYSQKYRYLKLGSHVARVHSHHCLMVTITKDWRNHIHYRDHNSNIHKVTHQWQPFSNWLLNFGMMSILLMAMNHWDQGHCFNTSNVNPLILVYKTFPFLYLSECAHGILWNTYS